MNTCINCSTETKNPKYCSRSCSASYNNKIHPKRKSNKKCSKCSNITRSYRHTLCLEHWDQYQLQKASKFRESTLLEYWSRDSLKNLHPSSKNAHIRGIANSWFKNLKKLPCAACGYCKHVELCHIKPISTFSGTATISDVNNRDNIIQLCPNCHWELDHGLLTI